MLCEVCYFFCGGTDSYFEENAKDGTISGRNHLRKELVMKVESSSYEAYLEALEEWEAEDAREQATQQKEENSCYGQLCAGHQPDGHGHSDAEQHLQCTGDDERRTPANAADAAAGDGRDDGEHTGHGNDTGAREPQRQEQRHCLLNCQRRFVQIRTAS